MAIPPFNNTRLNPHEVLDKKKQEELFDAITRNLEDLYNRFATTVAAEEAAKKALESKRVITGAVNSTGAVIAGTGFTAARASLGSYTITLTTELATDGVIVATQIGGAVPSVMIVGVPTKKVFGLESYQSSNATLTHIDSAFTFQIRQI